MWQDIFKAMVVKLKLSGGETERANQWLENYLRVQMHVFQEPKSGFIGCHLQNGGATLHPTMLSK
jgi:Fe-S cluster assembly ATPase SufC